MAECRPIRADELDDLLALYRMLNPDDPELEPAQVSDLWDEMLRDESLEIVVVEHDGRLVSSCVLSMTANLTRGARPFAVIENVVTHEGYRGNGFGTRCVRTATTIAARRDCYKIMLLTGSDERWKHEFYEDCGFDRDAKTGFVLDLR
ncbi:GNAT family N-acetyltransferase [Natronobiforma cellulositropha]|uniref:GNAT family N-acetyltransferase n=1 Tax=Natronobiforma cellulositropha TaxID=1679076 RepID=UPI0021D5DDD0|nr:GNAT family N-acetyltransferase [Natronobiforma cellulositropha]